MMKRYTVPKGTEVSLFLKEPPCDKQYWEYFTTEKETTYDTGDIIIPQVNMRVQAKYVYFRLPKKAGKWVIMAVERTDIKDEI